MNREELIKWCDPKTPMGERPEQTNKTWAELTEELRRLDTAELIIDAWTRFFWACEGPTHVLWNQSVKFLGDKYTGYDREKAK